MLYLAEFYLPEHTALAAVARRARAGAARAAGSGADIRFVQAIFIPTDESCFAVYSAGSDQDVTAAGNLAGLVFDRIVTAVCDP